ncbi:hypothetical protein EV361DRAFT_775267, partial [Lentinula raphanica]
IKNVKIKYPDPWDGDGNIDNFETWINSVINWMVVNRLTGPEGNGMQVLCLEGMLDGDAKLWYHDHVTGPHRVRDIWKTEEVLIGLFKRFVQDEVFTYA